VPEKGVPDDSLTPPIDAFSGVKGLASTKAKHTTGQLDEEGASCDDDDPDD
jgi:hypothetical protein